MTTSTTENTAGVVVLYNPEEDILDNIASYLPYISVLYCIDNSETPNSFLVAQLTTIPKVHYIKNYGNVGIAATLNQGATMALKDHYHWLLTMDQDSKAHESMLPMLREGLVGNHDENIGIMAPFQQDKDNQHVALSNYVQQVETVMTSGNLLNLEAYTRVGPFKTKFFIDYVDHEYCLRLRAHGYNILQVPKAILFHRVGDITLHSILGFRITASNHSPLRRYYITRNRLEVLRLYKGRFPEYLKREIQAMGKDLLRIIFFEKEKGKKLLYMVYGVKDFWNKSFGKFQN
ncbi:glycosyltransferase family 2 protein [Rufibacter tibetensis]|uniref:Glycosyltransferase 2-like domain-containing protein n=1 Tax=Rufibacter tibetensis TaxID=512763 RepID=A0A0P0C550_9BACT|nr:glycosyltransferase family 2 protein [Rufibacter tibetensis]ALJ00322.1 hypothetical protein DC20_16775 [Rufibacter tibetensis]